MPDCLARSSSGGNAGSSRESREEWSKWLSAGKNQISQEVKNASRFWILDSRITHFYDFLPHWPHLALRSVSQGCSTDVVAAVVVAVVVHQRQHQRQCHAPETER